jgi:hypothetical protein
VAPKMSAESSRHAFSSLRVCQDQEGSWLRDEGGHDHALILPSIRLIASRSKRLGSNWPPDHSRKLSCSSWVGSAMTARNSAQRKAPPTSSGGHGFSPGTQRIALGALASSRRSRNTAPEARWVDDATFRVRIDWKLAQMKRERQAAIVKLPRERSSKVW